jgi:hypothetical protein
MKGGARNRSGPPQDPKSGRSERRGLQFTRLPVEGHDGEVPAFPLPRMQRTKVEVVDGTKKTVLDKATTERYRRRELAIWEEVWRSPQAAAWARPKWAYLHQTVAEFCRLKAVVEASPDANAALVAQLHRYRDQIGLTKAGMREHGWDIPDDELEARREEQVSEPAVQEEAPRRRLSAVPGA